MPTKPNVHLMPTDACLLVALVKYFFLVYDVKFIDLFFIRAVVLVSSVHEVVLKSSVNKSIRICSTSVLAVTRCCRRH